MFTIPSQNLIVQLFQSFLPWYARGGRKNSFGRSFISGFDWKWCSKIIGTVSFRIFAIENLKFNCICFLENGDDSNTLSVILLSASMMSLVITVMGIKLKWFRHRLTFEQPENQVASPVLLRTTSVTEIRENCARGIYKQTFDEESFIIRDSPKPITNGKTKAKSNSKWLLKCFSIIFLSQLQTFYTLHYVIMLQQSFLSKTMTIIDFLLHRWSPKHFPIAV